MLVKKAEYIISGTKQIHFPTLGYPEFVFLGRSNVGKSSLLNAIVGRKKLAYTSGKPGKTQTLNFFNINDNCIFVDVPGYGYAQRQKSDRLAFGAMIEEYLAKSTQLKVCFLVVDIRHQPSEDDILMYQYLKHFSLKVVILATKKDKLGKTMIAGHIKTIEKTLELTDEDKCLAVSSFTKEGMEAIAQIILSYL